jgi:hypothetical protein
MAMGPGKYDDLCQLVCERAGVNDHGGGAIVIVVGGNRGSGFSCHADLQTLSTLADLLQTVVDAIREDTAGSVAQ